MSLVINTHKEKTKSQTLSRVHWRNPTKLEGFIVLILTIVISISFYYPLYYVSDKFASRRYSLPNGFETGWLPGTWIIDVSDSQYKDFRNALVFQSIYALIYLCLSHSVRFCAQSLKWDCQRAMVWFYCGIGCVFTLYLHGTAVVIMWVLMAINFMIGKSLYRSHPKLCAIVTWIYNIAVVFICYGIDSDLLNFDYWISAQYKWNSGYRFIILKCISFNMDRCYTESKQPLYRSLFDISYLESDKDFTFVSFMAYSQYNPLYIAGPTISYHDWMAQIKSNVNNTNPNRSEFLNIRYIILYALRWIFCILLLETLLHFIFGWRFKRHLIDGKYGDPMAMIGYTFFGHILVTHFLWLKFVIIWRYYRLWALLDGINPIENMGRCCHHTDSVINFWRNWHTSFNHWLLRYIFIPLGGSKQPSILLRIANIFSVFAFTTLWHGDFDLSLLSWGGLMASTMCIEIAVTRVYRTSNIGFIVYARNNLRIAHYLSALGGSIIIGLLQLANLVGFGPGFSKTFEMVGAILSNRIGLAALFYLMFYFFVASSVLMNFETNRENRNWNCYAFCRIFRDTAASLKKKSFQS